jgi:hypothetical protein
MRDCDVRTVLWDRLTISCVGDRESIVLEELGLCQGSVRIDLAVVNGMLKGYEIKSDLDTLERLERQALVFSRVLDTVTLVVAEKHLRAAIAIVPSWWGLEVARCEESSMITINPVRVEHPNPSVDPCSVAQLLWRDEAISLLKQFSPTMSFSGKSRTCIWEYLSRSVPLDCLKAAVRNCIKNRKAWRADERQRPSGETFQPFAKSSDFQVLRAGKRNRRYIHRPS